MDHLYQLQHIRSTVEMEKIQNFNWDFKKKANSVSPELSNFNKPSILQKFEKK